MFTSDLPPVAVGGSTIPAAILDACGRYSAGVALIDDDSGRRTTFAQLAHRIDRVGAALSDRNLRGRTVAVWAPNHSEWMTMALGAMAAGATVTGINPVHTDAEVATHLEAMDAALLVTHTPLLERARSLARRLSITEIVVIGDESCPDCVSSNDDVVVTPFHELTSSNGASPDVGSLDPDHIAVLSMSSGTTGLAKRVELRHGAFVTQMRQISAATPINYLDRALALAPFSYAIGMVVTGVWPLSQGASLIITPRFNPQRFLPAISERRPTVVIVPPLLAGLLADHPAATSEALASIRLLGFGGAPSSPEQLAVLARRFPQVVVGQGYGLTELTCVAAVTRLDDPSPVGSVGRLVPNTELRVVDPDTGEDLSIDQDGELWIRGPQIMVGYRDDPETTAATVDADGWLHTGDLGHIDGDGNVFVVDRLKDLIKVKGFQVAPAELEQVLLTHHDVADAAVTSSGVNEEERPVGFVVPRKDRAVDPDDLAEWVSARVAPYKRLREIHLVDAIPRNPRGKILRRTLRSGLGS